MKALRSISAPGVWGNIRRVHGKAIVHNEEWPNHPFPADQTKESLEGYYKVNLSGFDLVDVVCRG